MVQRIVTGLEGGLQKAFQKFCFVSAAEKIWVEKKCNRVIGYRPKTIILSTTQFYYNNVWKLREEYYKYQMIGTILQNDLNAFFLLGL